MLITFCLACFGQNPFARPEFVVVIRGPDSSYALWLAKSVWSSFLTCSECLALLKAASAHVMGAA